MRLVLGPFAGAPVEVSPARPWPVDWAAWCRALIGDRMREPPREHFTEPDGWSVTIGESATGGEVTVHAFYAVLDQAVHARATVPASEAAELRRHLLGARLDWEAALRAPVALAEL